MSETAPTTRRVDQRDTFHDVVVPDPYRWLEADIRVDPEVDAWVTAQNAHTRAALDPVPGRAHIRGRLKALLDRPRMGPPFKAGGRYYQYRAAPSQEQAVLFVRDALADEPRVLLDPNEWSEDGTVSLAGTSCSRDGRYIIYGVSQAGSDWQVLHVLEIATGRELDDRVRWVKNSGTAWSADSEGFYYTRHPEPAEGEAFQASSLNQSVHFHRIGDAQDSDALIHSEPERPTWSFSPELSHDGQWLLLWVYESSPSENTLLVRRVGDDGPFLDLTGQFQDRHGYLGNDGDVFYLHTTRDAPNGRVAAVTLGASGPWPTRVPEAAEAIAQANLIHDRFVVGYLRDCLPTVQIFQLDGTLEREIDFPGIGTLGRGASLSGKRDHSETFYTFSGPTHAPSIYHYDLETGESTLLEQTELDFDASRYEVTQRFCESRDGTRVPMFIARAKGAPMDGSAPTIINGYGGFNIPYPASFSVLYLVWLELGGAIAMVNLRGGGEYGEAWHAGGMLERKQNVFDDFIAAAEYLIDEGYTSAARLASKGGSNGGLLVGATLLQRPDLFGAALPATGVMDMLRYHHFTAGKYWVGEYGAAEDPEMFPHLRAYSPVHNVDPEGAYPPTMVMTADTDDRVVPSHSFKFAAALQATGSPALLRVNQRAGHSAGMSLSQVIDESVDVLSFLVKTFEIEIG